MGFKAEPLPLQAEAEAFHGTERRGGAEGEYARTAPPDPWDTPPDGDRRNSKPSPGDLRKNRMTRGTLAPDNLNWR